MCYARILPIFFYSLTLSCSPYIFFIFLLIQRPPTSTLFPSRRSSDLERIARRIREPDVRVGAEIDARHDGHARRLEQEAGDVERAVQRGPRSVVHPAATEEPGDVRERVERPLRHHARHAGQRVEPADDQPT